MSEMVSNLDVCVCMWVGGRGVGVHSEEGGALCSTPVSQFCGGTYLSDEVHAVLISTDHTVYVFYSRGWYTRTNATNCNCVFHILFFFLLLFTDWSYEEGGGR